MATARNELDDARRLAERLLLPFEPLDEVPGDPELWSEVPLELLVRYSCVPLRREGARIVLAFGGLDDLQRIDELEFLLERPVEAAKRASTRSRLFRRVPIR